jgi:prophage regulatory protein
MRVLRSRMLVEKVGLSIQQIGRLEKALHFPKRFQLGPGSVGWIEDEVDAWLEERVRQRGPLPQPEKATKAAVRQERPSKG